MRCIGCKHENPATVSYCQRCGTKLNLTADEIRDSILQNAQGERAATTEDNARKLLGFGVFLLVIAVSLYVAVGSVPKGRVYVPSAADGADYVKLQWKYETKMDRALVPYQVKGRNP